jgi:hypothetical protein
VKVIVRITRNFKKEAKPLLKKYHSLSKDILALEKELLLKPMLGTPLGKNIFKIRLKITSKGKGKSGGARVISLVETAIIGIVAQTTEEETTVNLLSIYDKSEVATITDNELKDIINSFRNELE